MSEAIDLREPLRRYWGYAEFRPLQERIIRSILAGRDTAVVMPTGGGKSLCYQLPALVSNGTAVVISPLIALMQDQVAQLAQMGIPAAVLNSAIPWPEQSNVISQARQGAYRLLYLSPERLSRPETVAWLSRVPIAFFAIDEAHCISEWGHEFRPEYRQLSSLRVTFPERPIAAFTASATRRVRQDILTQLALHDPHKYIQSFHRPNLRYLAKQCSNTAMQMQLLRAALQAHEGDNVIVYAPTIARVEETVDLLAEQGVEAVPYHAKMDAGARQRNQERWMSDEVRVLVGTIAFGLGINKAAVRAVIHLSLPKSLEQYYQEAGRAGRDGLPSDCALLWQKKDVGLLAHFIDQITDKAEQQRAWDRYHVIRRFAESATCRQRLICLHFGETPKWNQCGMCDACCAAPEWMEEGDAVLVVERAGRKRKAEGSGQKAEGSGQKAEGGGRKADGGGRKAEGSGQKVEGSGQKAEGGRRKAEGDGRKAEGGKQTAEGSGQKVEGGEQKVEGGEQKAEGGEQKAEGNADPELVEYLKEWRRGVAVRENVPAYIVLHDTTLLELCRTQPQSQAELLSVSGIGERKAAAYGTAILEALEAFRNGARAAGREETKVSPAEETMRLLAEGRSFEEIARIRERRLNTIVDLVAELVERGRLDFDDKWIASGRRQQIEDAISRLGAARMKTIKDALPPEITYGEIRLVAAKLRKRPV